MFFKNALLRKQANAIRFDREGEPLAREILDLYISLKNTYKRAHEGIINKTRKGRHAKEALKDILAFYHQSETLLILLFNEIFQPNIMQLIGRRWRILKLLDRVMKMFVSIDSAKLRNPEVFCHYSQYKLLSDEQPDEEEEYVDKQLSIISLIVLPMGRLVLSLFSNANFEMYYPTLLGKRLRIMLTPDRERLLYMHCVIAEKYRLRYATLYLTAVQDKFYGEGSFELENKLDRILATYKDLLLKHL